MLPNTSRATMPPAARPANDTDPRIDRHDRAQGIVEGHGTASQLFADVAVEATASSS
jgi:hypothetical protein